MLWSRGLLGSWKLENTALDGSGQGNHGTVYGATYANGKFGRCLSFNGSGDFIDCGTNVSDTMEAAGTITMWTFLTSLGGLLSRSVGTSWVDERIVLHFDASSHRLDLAFADGVHFWLHLSANTVPINVWTHLAVNWDGTTVKHYFNARLDRSQGQRGIPEVTNVKTWIGRVEGLAPNYASGLIDEVQIWNRALIESDIRRVMLGMQPLG